MILPKDFDWKTYLKLNPDLGAAGLKNERQANYHFFHYGKKQNRRYKKGTDLEDSILKNKRFLSLDKNLRDELFLELSNFEKEFLFSVDSKKYKLDYHKLVESKLDFKCLELENKSNSEPVSGYKTSCVIAFSGRHKMVEKNVELLSTQSEKPAIVLVLSEINDFNFANKLKSKFDNVFLVLNENYPLGGKWQSGVDFSKKLNVDGVMILGSDDLLSLDYFKNCLLDIDYGRGSSGVGVDLVGNRSWFMIDKNLDLYSLSYKKKVEIFLGGGKMFSKNFLDKVDWVIFKKYLPRHLDDYGYELVKFNGNSMKLIDRENFILSIKGPWEVMNKSENFISEKSSVNFEKMTNNFKSNILNKLNNFSYSDLFD